MRTVGLVLLAALPPALTLCRVAAARKRLRRLRQFSAYFERMGLLVESALLPLPAIAAAAAPEAGFSFVKTLEAALLTLPLPAAWADAVARETALTASEREALLGFLSQTLQPDEGRAAAACRALARRFSAAAEGQQAAIAGEERVRLALGAAGALLPFLLL